MRAESYRGYIVRGFAWAFGSGFFVASWGVDKDSRRIIESEEIACYPSMEEAANVGLLWAKGWVDMHGESRDPVPSKSRAQREQATPRSCT